MKKLQSKINLLKQEKGFTLIEMLIVVAIIGILVAIAVPSLNTAKYDSQNRAAEGTSKTLNEAITRVILKGDQRINNWSDWTNAFGANSTNAVAFLIENGYLREK